MTRSWLILVYQLWHKRGRRRTDGFLFEIGIAHRAHPFVYEEVISYAWSLRDTNSYGKLTSQLFNLNRQLEVKEVERTHILVVRKVCTVLGKGYYKWLRLSTSNLPRLRARKLGRLRANQRSPFPLPRCQISHLPPASRPIRALRSLSRCDIWHLSRSSSTEFFHSASCSS